MYIWLSLFGGLRSKLRCIPLGYVYVITNGSNGWQGGALIYENRKLQVM